MDTFNLESGIIGYLLSGYDVGKTLYSLSVEDFAEPLHQNIFSSVKHLFSSGAPVNTTTVARELRQYYEEEDGEVLDKTLREYTRQKAPDIKHYVNSLLDDNSLKRLNGYGINLNHATSLEDAQSIARDIAAAATRTEKRISIKAIDAALAFADRLDKAEEKPPEYLDWHFPPLNEQLFTEAGDFIVLGGRPSAGKTMLSVQIALNMARSSRVGYVSLETSPDKLTDRAMSHLSGVPLWKIKKPQYLNADDYEALNNAQSSFAKLNFEIADSSIRTVQQIEGFAINRRIEVLFIDYLQIISGKGNSRYEIITNISQQLHSLAQTQKICIVALSQLSRSMKTASGKEPPPTLESLRESGQLEQDADAVMLLYLENSEDRGCDRILKLAKNKEGKCGKLSLIFNGETQTFFYAK